MLCAAVKYSENGSFIEAIRSLPESVQFDLKYFIETTLEQVDNGNLSSGVFTLGKPPIQVSFIVTHTVTGLDKVQPTPPSVASVRSQHVISIASPAVHHWLCSPCPSDVPTPKVSNHQVHCCVCIVVCVGGWVCSVFVFCVMSWCVYVCSLYGFFTQHALRLIYRLSYI